MVKGRSNIVQRSIGRISPKTQRMAEKYGTLQTKKQEGGNGRPAIMDDGNTVFEMDYLDTNSFGYDPPPEPQDMVRMWLDKLNTFGADKAVGWEALSWWDDFSSDWSEVGGDLYADGSLTTGWLQKNNMWLTTEIYKITFDYEIISGTIDCPDNNAQNYASNTTTGSFVYYLDLSGGNTTFFMRTDNFEGYLRNLKVERVEGNYTNLPIISTYSQRPQLLADGLYFYGGAQRRLFSDTITLDQPTTTYFVFKVITWYNSGGLMDGILANSNVLSTGSGEPNCWVYYSGASLSPTAQISYDWQIARWVANNLTSSFQMDAGTKHLGNNWGVASPNGLDLGGNNIDFYCKGAIVRKIQDADSDQDVIYDWLKAKYGV